MTGHLLRIAGITCLAALCISYPFLPGPYDSLAAPLSGMVQGTSMLSAILVTPIAILWLVSEARHSSHVFRYRVATAVASFVVGAAVVLMGLGSIGVSLALPLLAAWLYALWKVIRSLRRLKTLPHVGFDPSPLYFAAVPLLLVIFQFAAARPATDISRRRAMQAAGEIISELEQYRAREGRYPPSLLGIWKDYDPSVVAVERFHYSPHGEAYSLFFEQPRFVHDQFGTREFVVYNPRDEHLIVSHTAWMLRHPPERLQSRQGWYAVRDASQPHWKYFWFD